MFASTGKRVLSSATPPWLTTRLPLLPSCPSSSARASHPSLDRVFSTTVPYRNAPNPHLTPLLRLGPKPTPSSTAPRVRRLRSPYKLSMYSTPNHTMITLSTQASTISQFVDRSHEPTREEVNQSLTVLTLTTRMHATSRLPKGSRKSDLGRRLGPEGVGEQAQEISALMLHKIKSMLKVEVQEVQEKKPDPTGEIAASRGLDPRIIGSTRYPWPRPTSIKMEYRGKGPGRKAFYAIFTGPEGQGLQELIEGVEDDLPKREKGQFPKKRIHILREQEARRIKEKKEDDEAMAMAMEQKANRVYREESRTKEGSTGRSERSGGRR
ncbi:BZ3500_MvSof-1268-A1-R1_Chr3-1g06145 [Microbotryum saponariae]|uniref:BZ3500_MvSof-1268-A1-R1_Chr3-1g06145 protein n=1 Tax=Microbotryum saponariae TaxID=289078 RepID=A0A2X0N2Z1_9BASI|nr:BZ3500_MvSof-1268-A1-R1_Chr3-1g06145 [Microbotryum saponariae]SDA04008.1 BZ3501_MvSof-1269-A2-R1_Chr3-2g05830 [Microbotryum saponariae]